MSELEWDLDEDGDLVAFDDVVKATVLEIDSVRGSNYWMLLVASGELSIEVKVDSVEDGKALATASIEAIAFWNKRAGELLAQSRSAR